MVSSTFSWVTSISPCRRWKRVLGILALGLSLALAAVERSQHLAVNPRCGFTNGSSFWLIDQKPLFLGGWLNHGGLTKSHFRPISSYFCHPFGGKPVGWSPNLGRMWAFTRGKPRGTPWHAYYSVTNAKQQNDEVKSRVAQCSPDWNSTQKQRPLQLIPKVNPKHLNVFKDAIAWRQIFPCLFIAFCPGTFR
jgi:hypothetical protein